MNREQVAGHRRGSDHALERGHDQSFVSARPILRDEIDDGLHRIITGDDFREMVHRPDLRVILNARDVLIGTDFVDGERCAVTEKLPRGGQILPERHLYFAPTFRRDGVELRSGFDDSALTKLRQFGGALDGVFLELSWNDDVGYGCFSHDSISPVVIHYADARRRSASFGSAFCSFICSVRFQFSFVNGFLPECLPTPPEPLPTAPPPAEDSNKCGASTTCRVTHSSKVKGVTPSRPNTGVLPSVSTATTEPPEILKIPRARNLMRGMAEEGRRIFGAP